PDVPDAPAARPVPDVPDGGTPMNSTAAPAPSEPREHLEQLDLPFWLEHGIDTEVGGFLTCFDNRGAQRVSTAKFTWSEGRFVWLLARAGQLPQQDLRTVDAQRMLDAARDGARFLLEHAVRSDATTRFGVGRRGGRPESARQPE